MTALPVQPRPVEESERALSSARFGIAALFFINGMVFANWVSRIPAVQMARGLSHAELGAALLVVGIGAFVAMPLTGWLAGRWGSDRVSRWMALGYCAALPFPAIAPGPVGFAAALFGFGAVHGALDVAMNAQAVEIERRCERPILSSIHALFSAGGLAGAVLGGFAAAAKLSPLVHFIIVAIALALAIVILVFPRLLPDRSVTEAPPSPAPAARMNSLRTAVALLLFGIIAFCVMMGEGAMADWSALFLRQVAGASEGLAAAGYAAFSIAMAVGRFSGDRLSMRFGPVTLVRAGGALAATGLTLALLSRQPAMSLIGFAAVGAGFATVVPQVFSAAGRAHQGVAGAAVAAVTTVGYLGFLLGPPIIGFAAQHFGLSQALGLLVFTSLLMTALAGGLGRTKVPATAARRPKPDHPSRLGEPLPF